jgi:hypothetical protein
MSVSESRRSDRLDRGAAPLAGIILATASVFQILQGIAALADDKVYVEGIEYTFQLDITAWGWIHLAFGCIGLVVAVGIFTEQVWGWILGVSIASLSAVSNFLFMPYFPLWSLVVIALDVFIIWALCRTPSYERF